MHRGDWRGGVLRAVSRQGRRASASTTRTSSRSRGPCAMRIGSLRCARPRMRLAIMLALGTSVPTAGVPAVALPVSNRTTVIGSARSKADARARSAASGASGGTASPGGARSVPAASPQAPLAGPVFAASANASFARLTAQLPGRLELAVAPIGSGSTEVLGSNEPAHGWSTTKVPVLVALLKARGERGLDRLTAQQLALARSAITESNNESVLALFADLEQMKGGLVGASRYIQGLFRASGDSETVVSVAPPPPGAVTTFGQTEWRPSESVKFFRALAVGCLIPSGETSYVLNLMEHIESSESWGLGSAGFRSIAFKGGWGPSPSGAYLVRQSAIIDPGSSRAVAVSVVAFPNSGSFSTGVEMLGRAGTWLRRELRLTPRSGAGCAATE